MTSLCHPRLCVVFLKKWIFYAPLHCAIFFFLVIARKLPKLQCGCYALAGCRSLTRAGLYLKKREIISYYKHFCKVVSSAFIYRAFAFKQSNSFSKSAQLGFKGGLALHFVGIWRISGVVAHAQKNTLKTIKKALHSTNQSFIRL